MQLSHFSALFTVISISWILYPRKIWTLERYLDLKMAKPMIHVNCLSNPFIFVCLFKFVSWKKLIWCSVHCRDCGNSINMVVLWMNLLIRLPILMALFKCQWFLIGKIQLCYCIYVCWIFYVRIFKILVWECGSTGKMDVEVGKDLKRVRKDSFVLFALNCGS